MYQNVISRHRMLSVITYYPHRDPYMKQSAGGKLTKEVATTNEEIRVVVGKRIQSIRRSQGQSASTVAKRLGTTREALTQIETGRNNINAVTIWKLACLLGCSIEDFFPGVPKGFALTPAEIRNVSEVGGRQGVEWAKQLFGK